MTESYYAGRWIRGTNAERTGGTWTNLNTGWMFIESDTQRIYWWTGSAWTEIGYSTAVGTAPQTVFTFIGPSSALSTYVVRYYPVFGAFNNPNATESAAQSTFPNQIILKRILAKFSTNGLNGSTIIGFRDDAANASTISIGAGVTTEVDSGAISVIVASGSKIAWLIDTSASSSGTWLPAWIYAIGVVS